MRRDSVFFIIIPVYKRSTVIGRNSAEIINKYDFKTGAPNRVTLKQAGLFSVIKSLRGRQYWELVYEDRCAKERDKVHNGSCLCSGDTVLPLCIQLLRRGG